MSAPRPASLLSNPLFTLVSQHLTLLHRGKIRDSFALSSVGVVGLGGVNLRLVITTDGLSIFDFVLGCQVPGKGMILNALTVFWSWTLNNLPTDLVAYGPDIDHYLPTALRGNSDLHRRALVVRECEMVPVEAIARGYLTGSGLESYRQKGAVCGISLPTGLHDGSQLKPSLFTPSTKAERGHDEHLSAAAVSERYPWMSQLTLDTYNQAAEYALGKGVIIADTKFEFGIDPMTGAVRRCDESLTADSSRFWDRDEWSRQQGATEPKSPTPWDKQVVREQGKRWLTPFRDEAGERIVGINRLDPENPDHLSWVHQLWWPTVILEETASRYHTICERLTGETPEQVLGL